MHGDFRIRTELLDPPRYAAFRWLPQDGDDVLPDASTLVEFRIEDRQGGVRLSVVESGFSTLSEDRETWLKAREENVEGWRIELGSRGHPPRPGDGHPLRARRGAAGPGLAAAGGRRPARPAGTPSAAPTSTPTPGGAVELRWEEHGAFRGRVVEVVPHELFSFRLAVQPDADPGDGTATLVELSLRPSGEGGTLLTVRQTGYPELDPGLGAAAALADQDRDGWEAGLGLLVGLVDTPAEAGSR